MSDAFALGGRVSLALVRAEIDEHTLRHGEPPTVIEMTDFEWAVLWGGVSLFFDSKLPLNAPTIFGVPVRIIPDRD